MESDHHKLARRLISTTGWSEISGDVWAEEIFKRLRRKSLGRSRCVCKGWNSLITSPLCIANHHSFFTTASSTTQAKRQPFLLHEREPFHLDERPYSYAIYRPLRNNHLRPLSFPFQFRDIATLRFTFELVDVVNGVACVSYSLSSSFDSNLLWNPAIRTYVALPRLRKKKNRALQVMTTTTTKSRFQSSNAAIGFGYQSSKCDFKVVRVWIPSAYKRPRYEVYSSQQGLWREAKAKTKAFNGCGFITPTGCFVNGTVHWLLLRSSSSDDPPSPSNDNNTCCSGSLLLFLFDCEQEEFRTIVLPEELNHFPVTKGLFKYSGMLSLLRMKQASSFMGKDLVERWVMQPKSNTWNKLFSIEISISHYTDWPVLMTREGDDGRHTLLLGMDELGSDHDRGDAYKPLNGYAYEESMFLMGCQGAKCYANEEVVVDIGQVLDAWRCPPPNWIKMNIHVAFRGGGGSYGNAAAAVGAVFRDHKGRFVHALSSKLTGGRYDSALAAQLGGLWKGLETAKFIGIQSLLVETDAIQLVQAMKSTSSSDQLDEDERGCVDECMDLIEGLDPGWGPDHPDWRVGIRHAPAKLNKVARWFAKSALKQGACFEELYFNDCPCELEQLIANDIMRST